MSKPLLLIFSLLSTSLFAEQITITARIAPHANIQTKAIQVDNTIIRQDIYLKTNHEGLTIALSKNSSATSTLINYEPIGITPINLSDKIYAKSTRIGELIIPQKKKQGSLGVTLSVK